MPATKKNPAQQRTAWLNTSKKKAVEWKKSREAKPGQSNLPDIEDGIYQCRVTAELEVGDRGKLKGHALVRFVATIAEGDYEGQGHSQMYNCTGTDWGLEAVARDLKGLMPDRADEIESCEISELPGFIDALNEDPPLANVSFENGETDKGKKYLNIRLQGLVDGEAAPADEDETDGEAEEEASEGETEEEESADYEPEKDDEVGYKLAGRVRKCKVATVNRSKQTVSLKDDKGKVYKDVAWDKLIVE